MTEQVAAQKSYSGWRIFTFILSAVNLAWWLLLATSRWDNEGQPIDFYQALQFAMMVIVPPLVTLPALYLAWKNIRLKLAAFLAGIPWMFYLANAIIFAIGVAIHGF